jgi:hypothetical protein
MYRLSSETLPAPPRLDASIVASRLEFEVGRFPVFDRQHVSRPHGVKRQQENAGHLLECSALLCQRERIALRARIAQSVMPSLVFGKVRFQPVVIDQRAD